MDLLYIPGVSEAVWSVPLPADAEPPFEVYVNAQRRQEGVDFVVEGRWLRFSTPLRPQPQLGLGRRLMLALGIGVYGDLRGDTVDVSYRTGGRSALASGLPIIAPQEHEP
jgi:hypothetical protein